MSVDLDIYAAAIGAGDAGAFASWLAGAEPRIRASLARFATAVDTEAVLQEALLRVWQVAPRFAGDGKPDGLLRMGIRIARNVAVSEIRRHSGRRAREDEVAKGSDAPPALPSDPLLRRAIADCHDKLPPRPKQALAARLESRGNQADATLAELLSMTKNTFLQNITRARKLLADCLRANGVELWWTS